MFEGKGKLNIYTCETCHGHIVTVDAENGVTPFTTTCKATPGCKGYMRSSFYRVFDQTMKPSFEWYKPTDISGLNETAREHVERGGLLLRPFEGEWNPPPM